MATVIVNYITAGGLAKNEKIKKCTFDIKDNVLMIKRNQGNEIECYPLYNVKKFTIIEK